MDMSNEVFFFRSVSRSGIQKAQRIQAPTFEIAHEKALDKFSHIITKRKTMDLMTALERAAKASATTKKAYYIILEEDGECSVGTAPLKGATHKFVAGAEDKTFKPKQTEDERPEKAIEETTSKSDKKVVPLPKEKTKSTSKTMETKPKKATKKVAKKAAKKTVKAKAPKGEARVYAPKPGEKKVNISIKDMIAGIKKGFRYRDPQGVFQSEAYLKTRANQDYVRDGMWVVKPA
jgi:hypothetical protein